MHPTEGKRVRFQPTTMEASSEQVVEAMAKIAIHIGNPGKFSKASKLALQLLQAGSVNLDTADPFFRILKAAMVCPSHATDAALRSDYQALFNAVHEKLEVFLSSEIMLLQISISPPPHLTCSNCSYWHASKRQLMFVRI